MPMNIELKEYLEKLNFTEGNSRIQGEYVLESICRKIKNLVLT